MPLFADTTSPWAAVFLAGLILTIWILLWRARRYYGRPRCHATSAGGVSASPRQPPAHHDEPPEAMTRWEVEMYDTARELSAQLDNKMSALQALIREADRAAARLEAALDKTGAQAATPPTASRPPVSRDEVYTLADYGFDAAEISHRTGLPIGEVQLMLGIRGSR